MMVVGLVSTARLASLASGRGGAPSLEEWPIVLVVLALVGYVGTRILLALGLTRIEALLVAAVSPLLVLVDAPLGHLSPSVRLAANAAGCIIPCLVGLKLLVTRRAPLAETLFIVGAGVIASYFASHVDPDRGVLLQYRLPAALVGTLAAGLLFRREGQAGAASFAAGALGVLIGADALRLHELAGGAGRVVLGGAGLLDGILLVALLAAAIGELIALGARTLLAHRGRAQIAA